MKLTGNTILITGGANGIGLQLATELLVRDNTVIITGRDQAKLDSAKSAHPLLHTIRSDVSRIADIEALHGQVTKEFPALNVLINNAGIGRTLNLHTVEGDLEALTNEIDINLKGPIRMSKRFLDQLKKGPNAAIVNISSGLAFVPLPIMPIYCATKAALHSFTLSLRAQLKQTKIQVFELAPPTTDTDFVKEFLGSPDAKGIAFMKVEDLVAQCLKGMERDQLEVRPGQANQLKLMNRVAPEFILAQLSKPVDRMLGGKA